VLNCRDIIHLTPFSTHLASAVLPVVHFEPTGLGSFTEVEVYDKKFCQVIVWPALEVEIKLGPSIQFAIALEHISNS